MIAIHQITFSVTDYRMQPCFRLISVGVTALGDPQWPGHTVDGVPCQYSPPVQNGACLRSRSHCTLLRLLHVSLSLLHWKVQVGWLAASVTVHIL